MIRIKECEYDLNYSTDDSFRTIIDGISVKPQLRPDACLTGGRVKGFFLYKKAPPGHTIKIYDSKSMYPSIMKNKPMAVGPPTEILLNPPVDTFK